MLRRSEGSDELFIRPTVEGCFDRFSPWKEKGANRWSENINGPSVRGWATP
jgi:hypothetical protein